MKRKQKVIPLLIFVGLIVAVGLLAKLDRVQKQIQSAPNLKQSKYGLFLAGYHAKKMSDFKSSADYYERVYTKTQDDKDIIKNVYLLNVFSGELDKAEKYSEDYTKEFQKQTIPAFIKITQAIKTEDYKKALKEAKGLEDKKQNQPLVKLIESWLYAGEGDYKKAIKTLEVLKKDMPNLYHVHKFYIATFMDQKADVEFTIKVLKDSPISLRIIKDICIYLIQNKNHEEAVKFAKETIRTENSYSGKMLLKWVEETKEVKEVIIPTPKQGIAEAFTDFNLLILNPNTWELSLVISQLALELDPSIVIAKLIQAELLENQKQYERANKIYATIDKSEYIYPSTQVKEARNLALMGFEKEAIEKQKKNIQRYPDFDQPKTMLAKDYLKKREYKKALKLYNDVINYEKENNEKGDWKTYYYRALVLDRLEQYDKVENDLQTALTLSDNNPVVLNYLGYFWIERGIEDVRALKLIEASLMKLPKPEFWDSLGWAFFKLGKTEESLRFLELAVQRDPANPTAHEHLGDVYYDLGRVREAGYQWKRALLYKEEGLGLKDPKLVEEKINKIK